MNYTGVFLHTREYGVTYNLFDPPNVNDPVVEEDENDAPSVVNLDYEWPPRGTAQDQIEEEQGLRPLETNWRTGAVYYATLVIAEAISSGTSSVLDLGLDLTTGIGNETMAAYAIYDSGVPAKLVLFNYDYPKLESGNSTSSTEGGEVVEQDTSRTFLLPSNLTTSHTVSVRYLTATNITSHTQISWAGQRVGSNGALEGEQATIRLTCPESGEWSTEDACVLEIKVPGPGLALVWFDPDTKEGDIFFGDSTLVGVSNESNAAREGMRSLAWRWSVSVAVVGVVLGALM